MTNEFIAPEMMANAVSDKGVLRGAIGLTAITLIGFGFIYSLLGVGVGQVLFPAAANGSLLTSEGRVIGSVLVAQPFTEDKYFASRPSAAGYNPMALAGSNQARTNPDLRARLATAVQAVAEREGVASVDVPSDLVTQSGSGMDPHISPQAAAIQIDRVARARGLSRSAVETLLLEHIENKPLGIIGQPRVNVLLLNMALDTLSASTSHKM